MSEINLKRRKLAALVTLVPVAGLVGCSEDKGSSPSTPAPKADPKPMVEKAPAPETMEEPESEAAAPEPMEADSGMEETGTEMAAPGDGGLPKLEESDSSAVALNYKHNADELDASAFPTLTAETRCSNCQLYQGGDNPWGACPIFPGKQVKATGWCTAYTPKAGA